MKMAKKRQQEEERKVQPINESTQLLRKQTIKELKNYIKK